MFSSSNPGPSPYATAEAAAAFVRDRLALEGRAAPRVAAVLGSGLGRVADELVADRDDRALPYGAIPHFPVSSVEGHKGRLVVGEVSGTSVLLLQGRVHRYEGFTASEVAFPMRVLRALGVGSVVLTNAAGGIGEGFAAGDLMRITDHINLTGGNPLVGPHEPRLGPRFPDMSAAYSPALGALADDVAARVGVPLRRGVYAGVLGPSYETPAEIRMLRTLGAHAVGMSTVYETIAAQHMGLDVVGISCITNLAAGLSERPLSHDEVKETADRVSAQFSALVLALLPAMARAAA